MINKQILSSTQWSTANAMQCNACTYEHHCRSDAWRTTTPMLRSNPNRIAMPMTTKRSHGCDDPMPDKLWPTTHISETRQPTNRAYATRALVIALHKCVALVDWGMALLQVPHRWNTAREWTHWHSHREHRQQVPNIRPNVVELQGIEEPGAGVWH
jgi:hypothetical protein